MDEAKLAEESLLDATKPGTSAAPSEAPIDPTPPTEQQKKPLSARMAVAVSGFLTMLSAGGALYTTGELQQINAKTAEIGAAAIADNRTEMFAAAPTLEARDVANPDIGDAGCKQAATVMAKDSTYYIDTTLLRKLREQNALLVAAHEPVFQVPNLRVEARDMPQLERGDSVMCVTYAKRGDSTWAIDTTAKMCPQPPEGQVSDVWLQVGHANAEPRKAQ